MREFEFEGNAWPTTVRDGVMHYYPAAEELLKVTPLARTEFQDKCKVVLKNLLGQTYLVSDAPEAVQTETTDFRRISTGLFSTADLLTENQATDQLTGASNLTVNLAHDVRQVLVQGRNATGVRAFDRIARYPRTYNARKIIMAAGTLETAKLAVKSGLADSSGKMANGITDHQIWFVGSRLEFLVRTEVVFPRTVVFKYRNRMFTFRSNNCACVTFDIL
jgi:choline dehydrogenase-like flavoprotein